MSTIPDEVHQTARPVRLHQWQLRLLEPHQDPFQQLRIQFSINNNTTIQHRWDSSSSKTSLPATTCFWDYCTSPCSWPWWWNWFRPCANRVRQVRDLWIQTFSLSLESSCMHRVKMVPHIQFPLLRATELGPRLTTNNWWDTSRALDPALRGSPLANVSVIPLRVAAHDGCSKRTPNQIWSLRMTPTRLPWTV